MARKSAISGEYIITQEDNGSIRVCQIFDNVIASLREAAKSVGFKIEPNWKTTQGIGKKMVDALGDGYTAEAGEYTIVRRDSGHIDTYRVHGNTKKVLNTIASAIDFPMNPGWNTRTAGSKLIDFINGDYTPENAAEPEEEMFEIRPDMTILELFENFKAQFGGHLRIKDGVKRCDPHWNHQTTAVWVPVTEGTLDEIGCKSPGKFSVDMKVGEFQDEVKKVCGITVIVATPDNYVTVLPEFTLDAVNILPPALTKAKMQDILDR